MTLRDRTALIDEVFASCQRLHPHQSADSLADMASYRLARDWGLCVSRDEVLAALARSAEPVEGPL